VPAFEAVLAAAVEVPTDAEGEVEVSLAVAPNGVDPAACSKSPESAWSATTLTTAAYRRLVVAAQVLEGLVDQANESEHGEQRDESAERVAQIGAAQRK